MRCVLLAGNRRDYKPVGNKPNKALLEVAGSSIIVRMLDQLQRVPQITEIAIVGPIEFLKPKIDDFLKGASFTKKVHLVQQGESLVENVYLGIEGYGLPRNTKEPIFILPGDLPLVQHQEIQEFLEKVDLAKCDFATGLASSDYLRKFYPAAGNNGIVMSYFYFSEGAFRANNFHLVKPGSVAFADYISRTYHLRYQKRFKNVLLMLWELLKLMLKIPTGIFFYIGMQWVRMLQHLKLEKIASFFVVPLKIKRAEGYISVILGTRYRLIPMARGGAALDVDNDTDYATICSRYAEWIEDEK